MENQKKTNELYSSAITRLVKLCKIWGFDDGDEDAISEYLRHTRENNLVIPEHTLEELSYANTNKNDFYRVYAEMKYHTQFSIKIRKTELKKLSVEQCIEKHLLSSIKMHIVIKDASILKFEDDFKYSFHPIPFMDAVYIKCTGGIIISSNNIYDDKNENDSFLGGEHRNYSSWFENKQTILLENDTSPEGEKGRSAKIKEFQLKTLDIIVDSSYE